MMRDAELRDRLELSDEVSSELPLRFDDEVHRAEDIARLAGCRALGIRNQVLAPEDVDLIYAHAPRLEQLVLDEVELTEGALARLVAPPPLHPLHRLGVVWPDRDMFAWDVVARSLLGQRLSSLSVHKASDPGFAEVLALPALTTLAVNGDLGDEAVAVLRAGSPVAGLRALHLDLTGSGRSDLAGALAAWSLPALELLRLEGPQLDGAWPQVLADAGMIANVAELDLGRAKIGTDALEALAARPLPRLRHLDLWGVTDRGARALARAPWAETLSSLRVIGSRASDTTWSELRAAHPALQLEVPTR